MTLEEMQKAFEQTKLRRMKKAAPVIDQALEDATKGMDRVDAETFMLDIIACYVARIVSDSPERYQPSTLNYFNLMVAKFRQEMLAHDLMNNFNDEIGGDHDH